LLLPDPGIRPIDRVRFKGRQRKHARPTSKTPSAPWQWADEPDAQ
jgi:hypothetical protein